MTHAANDTLNLTDVCVHCGATVVMVELDGALHWTHAATGYYTCGLNEFIAQGRPWSEYKTWGEKFTLAKPSKIEELAAEVAQGEAG